MKTELDQYNNDWYKPGKTVAHRLLWYCINALVFESKLFPVNQLKTSLLRLFGAKVGVGVVIKPAVSIKYPWRLSIGKHVWIGENTWIDNLAHVQIGDHVCISQGAMLLTGSHNYKERAFDLIVKDIVLEEGVWIGARAVVCPGVKCRSHSVLSVSSVATAELSAYEIYQGNPAISKRKRSKQAGNGILSFEGEIAEALSIR
ncbi:putative colanic acid biosynthesis acetyltransferase WcaF [Catalinimonas alkaloidigena]|uniref:WcaF family extracellular polysaccharide biosynthesis acetyltransferase n=1 Tax=Catalinimonas alkaloidigena TaxID=1075417 RepID=UPI002405098F|nr:WcaF family extracellular polysaccharide biosynthesis acetyltransferase [Catalinimonas alkaloidigena]MDF9798341.1 putative colanic acid biosynthesis acetyltransferase WcaF [Catalinimonas alkaloidigena]